MDLCNEKDIRALLARHGFRFSKSMGQNFLIEGWVPRDIAEASACARLIAAKHSIPTHMAPGRLFDRAAAERFDGPGRLILEPGEEITL